MRVETEKYRLIREQLIVKNATMPQNDTEGRGMGGDQTGLINETASRNKNNNLRKKKKFRENKNIMERGFKHFILNISV